jgi:hypothetical protein
VTPYCIDMACVTLAVIETPRFSRSHCLTSAPLHRMDREGTLLFLCESFPLVEVDFVTALLSQNGLGMNALVERCLAEQRRLEVSRTRALAVVALIRSFALLLHCRNNRRL